MSPGLLASAGVSAPARLTECCVSQEVKKKKDPAPLRSAEHLNHAAAWEPFNLTNWFLFPLLFSFFHAAGTLNMEVMSSSHPFKSDCGPYILMGGQQDLMVFPPAAKSNCALIFSPV